jgi:hypothetical protein
MRGFILAAKKGRELAHRMHYNHIMLSLSSLFSFEISTGTDAAKQGARKLTHIIL